RRDQEGARNLVAQVQPLRDPSLRRPVALERRPEPAAVALDASARVRVLDRDEDQPPSYLLQRLPEAENVRKLGLAGHAPGGPQVHESRTVGEGFERDLPVIRSEDREGGGCGAA